MERPQAFEVASGFRHARAWNKKTLLERAAFLPRYPFEGYIVESDKSFAFSEVNILPPPSLFPPTHSPQPPVDPRVLCLHLKKVHEEDAKVGEFNTIISCAVKCNTCVVVLGGGQDVKAAIHYLVKNLTKTPAEHTECIYLLATARKISSQRRSVDAATEERDAKFLFAKVLNQLAGLQEYSTEHCAAAALGFSSSYCSDSTTLCFAWGAAAAIQILADGRRFDDDLHESDDDDQVVGEEGASGTSAREAGDIVSAKSDQHEDGEDGEDIGVEATMTRVLRRRMGEEEDGEEDNIEAGSGDRAARRSGGEAVSSRTGGQVFGRFG